MGQSTDELRSEIEATRADLGETMDAIGDRVSPGRIIERRKNRMSNGLQAVRERVMGEAEMVSDEAHHAADKVGEVPQMVKQRTQGAPMMAGAIAFGLGFLAAVVFPATEMEREASEKLMDKAEPLKEQLTESGREVAEHLKEPAREAVSELRDSATQGAQTVRETAMDSGEQTRSTSPM